MRSARADAVRGDEAAVTRIHHLEIYVADLDAAARFYRGCLGFRVAVARQASGDRVSVALQRGSARLLLTAPHGRSGDVGDHLAVHGEGVKDIALAVRGLDRLFTQATAAGARPLDEPGVVRVAGAAAARAARVGICGDLVHTLIEASTVDGDWLPDGDEDAGQEPADTAIDGLDHVALALQPGEVDRTVALYVRGFGLRETHREDVQTEHSGMHSKVVSTPDGAVRIPLMEPATGRRQSQIDMFLQSHHGPGAQHLALLSHDIVKSVSAMRHAVEFLPTPGPYYDALPHRIDRLPAEMDALRRHGILLDGDSTGLLLQVFTKPIGMRPTLFLEVVERRGAEGFGSGNIRALFEAMERQQAATTEA